MTAKHTSTDEADRRDGSALSEGLGQESEHDDLFWHALNYRTAHTMHAQEMWMQLEACVARKVAAEREMWRTLISGPHEYNGDCPDSSDWHRRDPACPACAALGEWRA